MLTGSITNDIKHQFRYGNMVMKLIFVNAGVFLFVNIFSLLFLILSKPEIGLIPEEQLSLPLNFQQLFYQPWSIITYMFMHASVLHILFNMLWLYWFGEIFVLYLSEKKILPLYFLGGISGAFLSLLAINFIPAFEAYRSVPMVGASAAVIAIVFAAATLNPEHQLQLFLIGRVPLKYVALIPLLIDIVSIRNGNAGGYIAHIGGALSGYFYIKALQGGFDFASPFNKLFDGITNLFKPKSNIKVTYKNEARQAANISRTKTEQQRVDEILDKIARSGYDSLTKEEKDFLFNYSKK
jgi:membrane associated rhomboid family serine protease